jgi:hypothetical protein
MKKSYRRVIAALFLTLACSTASAGSTSGPITLFFTFEYPNTPPLLFFFIGIGPGPASCGPTTSGQNRWVIRTDTPTGKAHMTMLLMAKQLGRPVTIIGKGDTNGAWPNACDLWGDTESVHAVFLGD